MSSLGQWKCCLFPWFHFLCILILYFVCMEIIDNMNNVRAEVIHFYDFFFSNGMWDTSNTVSVSSAHICIQSSMSKTKSHSCQNSIFEALRIFITHPQQTESNSQMTFALKLQHCIFFLRTKNRPRITSSMSLMLHTICHYTIILNALNKKFMFVSKMLGKHIYLLFISLN